MHAEAGSTLVCSQITRGLWDQIDELWPQRSLNDTSSERDWSARRAQGSECGLRVWALLSPLGSLLSDLSSRLSSPFAERLQPVVEDLEAEMMRMPLGESEHNHARLHAHNIKARERKKQKTRPLAQSCCRNTLACRPSFCIVRRVQNSAERERERRRSRRRER